VQCKYSNTTIYYSQETKQSRLKVKADSPLQLGHFISQPDLSQIWDKRNNLIDRNKILNRPDNCLINSKLN
jgi:hypothetical protein